MLTEFWRLERNKSLFRVPVKTNRFIESVNLLFFTTCQEHDFVTLTCPCEFKCMLENRPTIPFLSVAGMGDNILNDTVWSAPPRKVRYKGKRTAAHQSISRKFSEIEEIGIGQNGGPVGFDVSKWRQWFILAMQVLIELKQVGQIRVLEESDHRRQRVLKTNDREGYERLVKTARNIPDAMAKELP